MRRRRNKNNKVLGFLGSASGGGALASAHAVCHAICTSAASLLAMAGIIISDTALMFLQDYNIYFWLMGLFFLLLSMALLATGRPVSVRIMIFNTGLLIASVPFYQSAILMLAGGAISAFVALAFVKTKMEVILWRKR